MQASRPLARLSNVLRLVFRQASPPVDPSPVEETESLLLESSEEPAELTSEELGAYLPWLLGADEGTSVAGRTDMPALLAAIDKELAMKGCVTRLVRRNPMVLPRLIRLLRDESYTAPDMARHIEQDVVLTAEVLRMARSSLYVQFGADGLDLCQSVRVLGTSGLEQVMARVVMWPLYRSDGSSLQARAAMRLWEESERCATACALMARACEVDLYDAYVAGLLQNTGFSALLRIAEIHHLQGALRPDPFAVALHQRALLQRRDRLLARLAVAWQLSPGLTAMGRALDSGAGGRTHQLLDLVRRAQARVVRKRLAELSMEQVQAA